MPTQKPPEYYRKGVRLSMWGIGAVDSVPVLIVLLLAPTGNVQWDFPTFFLLAFCVGKASLAFAGGYLCWKGRRIGRTISLIPAAIALLGFPVLTILGVLAITKLTKPQFVSQLR